MGKGGGALSMWIKEFTALVFTQTIQAFIYAIIISIILFGMVGSGGDTSADDNNAALGLMSTFALLSVFKVEDMAKKIFGISDTKATPGGAVKNLAKLAIAGQLGKKVLNNTGKVLGGIKSVNQAGQDRRKAKKRFDEDMKDEGFEFKNGKIVSTSKGAGQSQANANVNANAKQAADTNVALNIDDGNSSGDVGKVNVTTNDQEMSKAAYRRAKNALRTFEDKAAEINKARNEGIKSIASGIAETTGAFFGAAPGAVIGASISGEIEDALAGMVSGAGIGDTVGKNTVEAIDRATQFVKRNYKRESGISNREIQRAISGYKDALSKANVNYNSSKIDVSDIEI